MNRNFYYKIGVDNVDVLYYTKIFNSFSELIKYVKETLDKHGRDMSMCRLIVQAFKDNSYDFDSACFMQEIIPFGCLNTENVEFIISELVNKNWEEHQNDRKETN